ncbi:bifunctional 4-hydroxy-2-oxoglutarate aldolase/2-dehydro-3-deoxy-phosphogluconate aldolase [Propionispira raffinosivorans]|uniref:bifunctional 4-hydroxy-2-oxoglutarate aldolase/2-dehydro-3-deoxy-phosphogluconate aldolase n=1 Tax=Propionispira raffinosivorans TaxID=86959 RepID=UPI00037E1BA1|nr:bifunctional 4-hydroxy-2-oxoglutarate aldolase/2-dehydro-3-deoxy-phosphogluconate aldolase [Propionispira raffinosivorans]
MWTKFEILKTITDGGMVVIIRSSDTEDAYQIAKAAIKGGAKALEITFSVPNALTVIKRLTEEYSKTGIVIGAGTVLTSEDAAAAVLAGAQLLVSPNLNPKMIEFANNYQIVTISGALTPTEIFNSIQAGADIVKIFPADLFGSNYVKTLNGPLPQAALVPTGGVTPENVGEWLAAGCVAVGVGSYITKAHSNDGDYQKVTQAAEVFVAAIKQARQQFNKY